MRDFSLRDKLGTASAYGEKAGAIIDECVQRLEFPPNDNQNSHFLKAKVKLSEFNKEQVAIIGAWQWTRRAQMVTDKQVRILKMLVNKEKTKETAAG